MAQERLQKLLAQAGIASRRAAEALIAAGRVRVNGRIIRELGTRADLHKDKVEVDGRRLVAEKPVYYLLNKPREMVSTLSDPEGRATLNDLLKRVPERVFPVGRLDYHTSGAMLVTNDGEMADALLHPTKGVPKVYIAKVKGVVEEKGLQALRTGVVLDDGYTTAPAEVFVAREDRGNNWLSISIREGKNRQVHRMGDAVGHRVMRLSRVEFAGLSVDGLPPGAMRPLGSREVDKLKKDYLNPKKRQKANTARAKFLEDNAEFFDGWGEDVVEQPAEFVPRPAPRPRTEASGASTGRTAGGARKAAGSTTGRTTTARGKVPNATAERAVRALSEKRPPKDRSIGGAKAANSMGAPPSKPARAGKPGSRTGAGKPGAFKAGRPDTAGAPDKRPATRRTGKPSAAGPRAASGAGAPTSAGAGRGRAGAYKGAAPRGASETASPRGARGKVGARESRDEKPVQERSARGGAARKGATTTGRRDRGAARTAGRRAEGESRAQTGSARSPRGAARTAGRKADGEDRKQASSSRTPRVAAAGARKVATKRPARAAAASAFQAQRPKSAAAKKKPSPRTGASKDGARAASKPRKAAPKRRG